MVVLTAIGLIGGAVGLWGLYTAISHLITPVSIIVGGVAFLATYKILNESLALFDREWMNASVNAWGAALVGYLAYKSFVWILVSGSILTTGTLLLVVFFGGPILIAVSEVVDFWAALSEIFNN
ncbi:MAG: hypothetical protein SVU32_03910 [Candidatus Nanohaloarchaea archaeon]|nr:hypothetical protein [Candidatus Nanohaloarchaea archaeon]